MEFPISRERLQNYRANEADRAQIKRLISDATTTNIYILRLEGGRYYIGKSNDVLNRYQEHMNGNGSAWTRKYRPVSLERTIQNASPFDEDKFTKEYMSRHGIDKVRGGSYVKLELSAFQKNMLKLEIWSARNLCSRCGRDSHFVKDCYARTDAVGNTIKDEEDNDEEESDDDDSYDEWECEYCDMTFMTEFACGTHEMLCGQNNRMQNRKSTGGKAPRMSVIHSINNFKATGGKAPRKSASATGCVKN
jgi:predicted GIY-YIG superfamily endonuclease